MRPYDWEDHTGSSVVTKIGLNLLTVSFVLYVKAPE